ncbi:hypothetical protein GGR53DRAFT_483996 [Hypoxylon sp. FL1150]|nr:hypothetical protein GGR53DRAFT_483996 [Hypoxylon sp. FL1150]
MHIESTLALAFVGGTLVSATAPGPTNPVHEVKPRQTTNPGGPLQSLSSTIQTDTSSILLSIQTDTTISRSDSSTAAISSESQAASSSAAESSAALSSSVSDAGAGKPRETGFAVGAAAAVAIGFAGAVAAL